jgi:hypothetical protein
MRHRLQLPTVTRTVDLPIDPVHKAQADLVRHLQASLACRHDNTTSRHSTLPQTPVYLLGRHQVPLATAVLSHSRRWVIQTPCLACLLEVHLQVCHQGSRLQWAIRHNSSDRVEGFHEGRHLQSSSSWCQVLGHLHSEAFIMENGLTVWSTLGHKM